MNLKINVAQRAILATLDEENVRPARMFYGPSAWPLAVAGLIKVTGGEVEMTNDGAATLVGTYLCNECGACCERGTECEHPIAPAPRAMISVDAVLGVLAVARAEWVGSSDGAAVRMAIDAIATGFESLKVAQ